MRTVATLSACIAALSIGIGLWGPAGAAAQPSDARAEPLRFGAHAGLSATTLGTGLSAGLSVAAHRHVFTLRGMSTDPAPRAETWEVGVLYGRALPVGALTVSASTGVAVVGGTRYDSLFGRGPGEELATMIGFPLEAALTWTPTALLAVGVRGVANVNTGQPLGGVGLTLQVGRLR